MVRYFSVQVNPLNPYPGRDFFSVHLTSSLYRIIDREDFQFLMAHTNAHRIVFAQLYLVFGWGCYRAVRFMLLITISVRPMYNEAVKSGGYAFIKLEMWNLYNNHSSSRLVSSVKALRRRHFLLSCIPDWFNNCFILFLSFFFFFFFFGLFALFGFCFEGFLLLLCVTYICGEFRYFITRSILLNSQYYM